MITQGEVINIKPEWQDSGDDKFVWIATEDEDHGRVSICPIDSPMRIKPHYRVKTSMIDGTGAHYTDYRGFDYAKD